MNCSCAARGRSTKRQRLDLLLDEPTTSLGIDHELAGPLRMQARRGRMSLAPALLQRMPPRLKRAATSVPQELSTTPEPTSSPMAR